MKKLLCYGDSNTFGYDPRSYLGGKYEKNWPQILRKKGFSVRNEGQCGREIPRTSFQMRSFLQIYEIGEKPDLLLLMLGSNDLLNDLSLTAEDIALRMETFLREILSSSEEFLSKQILLIAPPKMQPGSWTMDHEIHLLRESAKLGQTYGPVAQRLGLSFIDATDWPVPLAFDGVHYTEEGHSIFAEHLFPCL